MSEAEMKVARGKNLKSIRFARCHRGHIQHNSGDCPLIHRGHIQHNSGDSPQIITEDTFNTIEVTVPKLTEDTHSTQFR